MEKTHTMKLFVKDPNDDQMYNVTINNVMRYELVMDHVSIGMSFRQVAVAIQHTRDRAKVAKLTGINDLIVGQYVRVGVGVALQRIADLFDDDTVWAFSLASDGSTHRGQHFLDQDDFHVDRWREYEYRASQWAGDAILSRGIECPAVHLMPAASD
ncbi:unnamed protein product [Sphagnum balticum]